MPTGASHTGFVTAARSVATLCKNARAMQADPEIRDFMLRVFLTAGVAFGAGCLFLYMFIKSLGDSDNPDPNMKKSSPLVRFIILVVTLFAFALLFMYASYQ